METRPFEFPYDRFNSEVSEEFANCPKYSKVNRAEEIKEKILFQKKYLIKKKLIKTGKNPTCFTMILNEFPCYIEIYNNGEILGYNEKDLIDDKLVGIPVFAIINDNLYIQRNSVKLMFSDIDLKELVEYRSIIREWYNDVHYLAWLFQNKTGEMIKVKSSFTNYFEQAFVALNFKRPINDCDTVMGKGSFLFWVNKELAVSFSAEKMKVDTWRYWPENKVENPKLQWSGIERWSESCTIVPYLKDIHQALRELQIRRLISDLMNNPIITFKKLIEKLVNYNESTEYKLADYREFKNVLGENNHYVQLFVDRMTGNRR
jgi:hypothetical protein